MPSTSDFALVEAPIPPLLEGQIEVQALLISVDPYMRPRLDAEQPLNSIMPGGGLGRVVRSRAAGLHEGTIVRHGAGFQDRFVLNASEVTPADPNPALPLSVYLHALGGTGLTAYGGLLRVGALQAGERVLISTAGGAVGSVAAQLARIKDCHVVGLTGSDSKCRWLEDEAGVRSLNYHRPDLAEALAAEFPRGIDVYFDNVGGEQLDAALPLMRTGGRIPVCGMISTYNGGGAGVHNLARIIYKRVRIEGFVATDFTDLQPQFAAEMERWLIDGQIKYQETILDGFEQSPEAMIALLSGANAGKILVRAAI
jgi:NADPH-dependent curcumin reductase CurA